jgi:SanA protein
MLDNHFSFSFKLRWLFYFIIFIIWSIWLINLNILNEKRYIVYDCFLDIDVYPVALVLGAGVSESGELGDFFINRLEKAVQLYQRGKVKKILISGYSSIYSQNEVKPARDFLLINQVKPEDIFVDYRAKNTFASLYRAKNLYGIDKVLIISQEFHLPRALYLANRLDLSPLACMADNSDYDNMKKVKRREFFAKMKAWLDINLNINLRLRETKFDISQDGRSSW